MHMSDQQEQQPLKLPSWLTNFHELHDKTAARRAAVTISEPVQKEVDDTAIAAAKEALRQKAEEEALKNSEPGRLILGQGVLVGQYAPKDREGNSLGKIFNVFAAPQDLTGASGKKETYKYVDAVKRIAALKNWNGFDGTNYATDKEIYKALKDGSYNGGWILPTRDLLVGTDVDGKQNQPDNIYAHKDKGSLQGTFNTTNKASGSDYPDWYWSSSEDRNYPSYVLNVRFSDGNEYWHH